MTTALDGAALLRAIIDDPADDLPRLAYADWLEESGLDPERVEFIRLQHANPLPFPPPEAFHGEYYPERWRHLWAYNCDRWVGLPRPRTASWRDQLAAALCQWRCGFLESVRFPLAVWREHGPTLVRQHPLARVELSDREARHVGGRAPDEGDWVHCFWSPVADHPLFGRWSLPPGIAKHLGTSRDENGWHDFPGLRAATDALSIACLAWARLPDGER